MDYHLLDDKHIEILAGDVAKGIWDYASGAISREGELAVNLDNNTKSLSLRKTQKVSSLDTLSDLPASNLMGMALGTLLGPLGGLASSAVGLVAGKHEFVCIGCELIDGRKFIARMRASVYKQWNKFCKSQEDLKKAE